MEIIDLLEKLKGKKLDETRFGLLRQAIELRQEKLKMLGKVNAILEENNLLLKEKIRFLEREVVRMRSGSDTRPVLDPAEPPVGSSRRITGNSSSGRLSDLRQQTPADSLNIRISFDPIRNEDL